MFFFGVLLVLIPWTNCQCPEGSFYEADVIKCEPCSLCDPGEEMKVPCSQTHDTECRKCPEHYFSRGGSGSCSRCATCAVGKIVISACNSSHDTMCQLPSFPIQEGRVPESVNTSESSTIIPVTKKIRTEWTTLIQNKGELPNLSLVVGLTVAVVLTVCGLCVTILLCLRLKNRKRRCDSLSVETSELEVLSPDTPKQSRNSEFLDQLKNEDLRMGDVTADLHEELARLLNPESSKGWRYLSGKLGFLIKDTNYFGTVSQSACQTMLSQWCTSRDAKLHTLACHLDDMGREDAVDVIQKWWRQNRTTNV